MKLKSVGQVILSRKLQLKAPTNKEVIIKIGKPQRFPDSADFYCPYQIVGMGNEQIEFSGGIDKIQSMILSLESIGYILKNSKEYKEGKLSWEASEHGNLGFPAFDCTGTLADSGLLPEKN